MQIKSSVDKLKLNYCHNLFLEQPIVFLNPLTIPDVDVH